MIVTVSLRKAPLGFDQAVLYVDGNPLSMWEGPGQALQPRDIWQLNFDLHTEPNQTVVRRLEDIKTIARLNQELEQSKKKTRRRKK